MGDNIERRQNAEANRFAIELLMPRSLIEVEYAKLIEWKKGMHEDEIVRRMAAKFEVSEVMMTMRLVELGLMVSP